MLITRKKFWIVVAVCTAIIAVACPIVSFQWEKARRRHQIGQLWTLIRLDYVPSHAGRYPVDLSELKSLRRYSAYFERAIHEIELTAPGIAQDTASPDTIVLKERSVDSSGGIWVHYVDGVILYRSEPRLASKGAWSRCLANQATTLRRPRNTVSPNKPRASLAGRWTVGNAELHPA